MVSTGCCIASAALLGESAPQWVFKKGVVWSIHSALQHLPSQHFKDEDAQSPPVDRSAMTFALDDFRGQVLGGTAKSPGPG